MAQLLHMVRFMNQAANILQILRKLAQFDAELGRLSKDMTEYRGVRDKIESLRAAIANLYFGPLRQT